MDRIVGIRAADDRTLRVYRRVERSVSVETVPYRPWLAIADPSVLDLQAIGAESAPLAGDEALRTIIRFDRWAQVWEAIQKILAVESDRRRQRIASYLDLPGLLFLSDPAEQWLAASGVSFFAGLQTSDLVRMQLAIETAAPPGRASRSDRSQDRILTIAATLSDGRKSTFRLKKQDEATLLNEFLAWFSVVDPDIVEGVELQSLTLPYLAERCALCGLEPSFGREGTVLRLSTTPVGKGPWELPGRVVLDHAEAMRHAGPTIQALVVEARVTQRPAPSGSNSTPARRCQEARRWTDRWWSALLPLMEHIPLPPDRFVRSGPGHWLEAWLVRDCLNRGVAIPSAAHTTPPAAEITPAGSSGWFAPAAELVLVPSKAAAWRQREIGSLATVPGWIRSILDRWEPLVDAPPTGRDRTIAIAMLTGLTDAVRARTSRLHVPSVAEQLDRAIARTATEIADLLRRQNVDVIQEIGERLYVQYPDNITGDDRRSLFWAKVNATLPSGLHAVSLRVFEAVVSLSPRIMHALQGSSAVQLPRPHPYRSPEAFLREFHARAILLVLRRQWNLLHQMTADSLRRIRNRSWHVSEFCRRETLAVSLDDYVRDRDAHRRNPSAPYEALLRAQAQVTTDAPFGPDANRARRHVHDAGSTVVYYIAGSRRDQSMADMSRLAEFWDPSAPDENTDHYVDRLRQSLDRYRPLLPEGDFLRVFGEESLFSFRDDEIGLSRTPFSAASPGGSTTDGGQRIWLDLPTTPT